MARQGVKRASSTGVTGKRAVGAVAKKCKTITAAIRHADLPQSIRSTMNDKMLMNVFGTYKEERIDFQNTLAGQVNTVLKTIQEGLQAKIVEAQANKATQDAEAGKLAAASAEAAAASEAASKVAADSKQALDDSHKAFRDAKVARNNLDADIKSATAHVVSTTAKKEKLEGLMTNFFGAAEPKKGGLSAQAASAGKFLESIEMEHEFVVCVVRTFSKLPADFGTFDKLIQTALDGKAKAILANFAADIQTTEAKKATDEANVETACEAIVTAAEKVEAAEEALTTASGAAKEAQAAAKAAAASAKAQQSLVDKATASLTEAAEAITDFQKGALAAFTEVEALAPPPPPAPKPEAEAPAAPAAPEIEEAMTAAPPKEQRSTPSVLASPGVLFSQAAQGLSRAVGLSPRISQSPR